MIISLWLGKIRISPGPSRHSIDTLDNTQLCFLRSLWHPARVCPLDVMDTIQMPHKCGQRPVTIWRSMSQVRKNFHSHNCFLTWEPFLTSCTPLTMFPIIMAEGSSWLLWPRSWETMILSEQDMRVIFLRVSSVATKYHEQKASCTRKGLFVLKSHRTVYPQRKSVEELKHGRNLKSWRGADYWLAQPALI